MFKKVKGKLQTTKKIVLICTFLSTPFSFFNFSHCLSVYFSFFSSLSSWCHLSFKLLFSSRLCSFPKQTVNQKKTRLNSFPLLTQRALSADFQLQVLWLQPSIQSHRKYFYQKKFVIKERNMPLITLWKHVVGTNKVLSGDLRFFKDKSKF